MTYSLKIWQKPASDDIRLYIGGTPRAAVYFKLSRENRLVWSSKANDTPHRFQTGDHYGKVRKDREAAAEVAAAYGVALGGGREEWDRLLRTARDGIAVEPKD